MKEPESLQMVGRTQVLFNRSKFSYFAGCDYFRMASRPEVIQAAAMGLKKYGLNVAASRITTGNHALYRELETALAKFFGAPAALLAFTALKLEFGWMQTPIASARLLHLAYRKKREARLEELTKGLLN